MMAEKARLFGDNESLAKIMASKSPREQKKLGRKVKNFDPFKWSEVCKEVVRRGNYAKFTQNTELGWKLIESEGTLVEASPYDRIWGIGLGEDDPRAQDRNQWLGANWLGEVLTEVRQQIVDEGWYGAA